MKQLCIPFVFVFVFVGLSGCAAPLSVDECAQLSPSRFCRALPQLECTSEDRILGELEFADGRSGYCCLEVSRECPPQER